MSVLRAVLRSAALLFTVLEAMLDFAWLMLRFGNALSASQRAQWLHRWCQKGLPRFGIAIASNGQAPGDGLLVANHLSYLDILVLSALRPCVFVSKHEVASWPLFGTMSRMAGTIFINRVRAADTHQVRSEMEQRLLEGLPVVLFPEATSSDGSSVLPFRSSLFQAAVSAGSVIRAAHISYQVEGGKAETDACYWGDMTLLPHVLKLFSRPRVTAQVRFSADGRRFTDRKEAARKMYEEVVALAQRRLATAV